MRNLLKLLVVPLAAAALSCVPGSSPIRIFGLAPVDTGMGGRACGTDLDQYFVKGRLDASGGGDFVAVLNVDSDVNADYRVVSNRGVLLTGEEKRRFVVDALFLTYRSVNPVITFEAEQVPIAATVPAGGIGRIPADIIGDKAAQKLRDMLTDPTITTTLTVNIQLRGHLESGETVHSNVFSLPIEVTTSNANCPTPGNVTLTGPCGSRGGQGGTTFSCCTGPGMPTDCP